MVGIYELSIMTGGHRSNYMEILLNHKTISNDTQKSMLKESDTSKQI